MNYLLAASQGSFDRWYGLIIGMGMILCILLAYFLIKKRGYNADIVFDIAVICIPIAIVGSRIYYIVFDCLGSGGKLSDWFNKDLTFLGFKRVDGKLKFGGLAGLAVYGGIIFAALAAAFIVRPLNRRKKNPLDQMTVMQMFDLFFAMIILGQAIGRIGCYFGQCCYGNHVTNPKWQHFPFAVDFGGGWVYATFFYESFFDFIGFGLLAWLYWGKRKSYDGFNFSVYCIWYGLTRAIIEPFRGDSLRIGNTLRVSQLVSILLILYGVGNVVYHIVMAKRAGKKIFIFVDEGRLNTGYYGYEKTIMHLRTVYKKDGTKTVEETPGPTSGIGPVQHETAGAEGEGIRNATNSITDSPANKGKPDAAKDSKTAKGSGFSFSEGRENSLDSRRSGAQSPAGNGQEEK